MRWGGLAERAFEERFEKAHLTDRRTGCRLKDFAADRVKRV